MFVLKAIAPLSPIQFHSKFRSLMPLLALKRTASSSVRRLPLKSRRLSVVLTARACRIEEKFTSLLGITLLPVEGKGSDAVRLCRLHTCSQSLIGAISLKDTPEKRLVR